MRENSGEKIKWIRKDTVAYFCVFIILTLNKSTNKIRAVLDFWTFYFHTTCTFVHYKFSPLIRLLYAKFRLLYTDNWQGRWAWPEGILEISEQFWWLLGWNKETHTAWLLEGFMPRLGLGLLKVFEDTPREATKDLSILWMSWKWVSALKMCVNEVHLIQSWFKIKISMTQEENKTPPEDRW
jgi:hypothetical protein